MRFPAAIVAIGLLALTSISQARTWHVERDGSGDYRIIQDAVNAAAAGDTIRIGPGRFNEGQVYSFPGWTAFVRVFVNASDLTFLGSGPETIIGQSEVLLPAQGEHRGIFAAAYLGSGERIIVKNLVFENTWAAIDAEDVDVEVDNCSFLGNAYGNKFWQGSRVAIRNCRFSGIPRDGIHVVCWGQSGLEVSDCTFILAQLPPGGQWHASLEGVRNGRISRCEFVDAVVGISISTGSSCVVSDCVFNGQSSEAVYCSLDSQVKVENSVFRNLGAVMYSGYSDIEFRRCRVENVERCSFGPSIVDRFVVNDCDLARGREGVVVVYEGLIGCEPRHLDFTNNYWGTDNPDSIRAWIHDANDSDRSCYFIDYEPFRSESTAAEKKSMGDVKALFH